MNIIIDYIDFIKEYIDNIDDKELLNAVISDTFQELETVFNVHDIILYDLRVGYIKFKIAFDKKEKEYEFKCERLIRLDKLNSIFYE